MNLQKRIELLVRLGHYMTANNEEWQQAKEKAFRQNNWFIPEFIDLSVKNIASNFLNPEALKTLVSKYEIPAENNLPKKVGIVMAGNIPLVGFHDMLCTFITGNYSYIKPSSKDEVLIKHIVEKLKEWNEEANDYFVIAEMLKGCDAYIATGSNNSSRYFEYYFGKYPNIIRKNRTSVAILTGNETLQELNALADDVHQYFGLGCRNATKIYVPEGYDFVPLLTAFSKYSFFENHNKYKNNYDHNLAMYILNNHYYMTNGSSVLLSEDSAIFSPISVLNYEFYTDVHGVEKSLENNYSIQCIVGKNHTPFGMAQCPQVDTYADGIDTINFLLSLTAKSVNL
jgi:hypothetical protein